MKQKNKDWIEREAYKRKRGNKYTLDNMNFYVWLKCKYIRFINNYALEYNMSCSEAIEYIIDQFIISQKEKKK